MVLMRDIVTVLVLNPAYRLYSNKMLCVLVYFASGRGVLIRHNFAVEHMFDVVCRGVVSTFKHLCCGVINKENFRITTFGKASRSSGKNHGTPSSELDKICEAMIYSALDKSLVNGALQDRRAIEPFSRLT